MNSFRVCLRLFLLCAPFVAFAQTPSDRQLAPVGNKPATPLPAVSGPRAQRPQLVLQTGVTAPAESVAFSPDGRLLAVLQLGGTALKLWETATGRELLAVKPSAQALLGAPSALWFGQADAPLLSFAQGTLRAWEAVTGRVLREFVLLTEAQGGTALFSADGRWLAYAPAHGDEQTRLQVWDVVSGRAQTFALNAAAKDGEPAAQFLGFGFSPDGRTLAACAEQFTKRGEQELRITLHESASGRVRQTFKLNDKQANAMARAQQTAVLQFSPDGRTLALLLREFTVAIGGGAFDGRQSAGAVTVRLLDATNGRELRTLNVAAARSGLTGDANAPQTQTFAFSPDGKWLAVTGNESVAALYEVASGRRLAELREHNAEVVAVAFNANGQQFVTASADNSIKLWDVASAAAGRATLLRTFSGAALPVGSLTFADAGRALAVGGNGALCWWDLPTGMATRTLAFAPMVARTRAEAYALQTAKSAFSEDGQAFASLTGNAVNVWQTRDGRALRNVPLDAAQKWPDLLALNRDGKLLAVADTTTERSAPAQSNAANPLSMPNPFGGLVIPPGKPSKEDRKRMEAQNKEMLRKAEELQRVAQSGDLSKMMEALEQSGFGAVMQTMPIAVPRGRVRLFDVNDKLPARTLTGRSLFESVGEKSVAFSADGRLFAAALGGGKIRLHDAASGNELAVLNSPNAFMTQRVVFSPDSKTCAAVVMEMRPGAMQRMQQDSTQGAKFGELFSFVARLWDVSNAAAPRELRAIPLEHWHSALAFSPDGQTLAVAGLDVRLFETATGRATLTLPGASLPVGALRFSPDGRWLAYGSEDGSTRLCDAQSGELLATLVLLNQGADWLVVTPDGLFDGTPGAWQAILWRFTANVFDVAPVESYFNEFFAPGLLADLYAGQRPRATQDVALKERRQPLVTLTRANAPNDAPTNAIAERTLKLRLTVAEPDATNAVASGARDVRLFRNGLLVKVWRGDVLKGQKQISFDADVTLVAGENRLTAYAFNRDNVKSADAALLITGAESLRRKGALYVLACGVNQYANAQYNLKFAVADAVAFAAELKAQQTKLPNYERVEIVSLLDSDLTKANLLAALKRLAGDASALSPTMPPQLANLRRAEPEDAVVLYFAGHGTASNARFYLIPHDLGYMGARDALTASGLQTMLEHGISDLELEAAVEGIDAGQMLCVIDACNSGQALEAEEKRRGPMNSKGLAQLAYEKGMSILTAAQSYQIALEAAQLGHGYLTFALIEEGLKQGSADRNAADGQILTREWFDYATDRVPQMQEQNLRARELKKVTLATSGNAPTNAKAAPGVNDVQRPRAFYRREQDARPFVVARH